MELLYLKTFCALVQWGNYTRTALELDYAQSSITNHIQRLEQLYGGQKLLQRSGNQVVPTAAGERLLPYARQMLELQQAAHLVMQPQPDIAPVLTIGTIESLSLYHLPDMLDHFRYHYPQYKVKVVIGSEPELVVQLKQGQIDVALVLDEPLQEQGLRSSVLLRTEMAVLVHHQHPLASRDGVTAHDLAPYPLILTEEGCTYRAYLLRALRQVQSQIDIRWELGSIESIRQAVEKQWGIGFLPVFVLNEILPPSNLQAIRWMQDDLNLYIQLLYPQQCSPAAEAFAASQRNVEVLRNEPKSISH
ncbi:LysR family transcriptional regulator [Paenibacillus kandeliae]|uniref:LysR family transcriptional regulator n=1 Tax=Paenibacillus kandeliae TaxID=3231269 RepID=UPI0034594F8D